MARFVAYPGFEEAIWEAGKPQVRARADLAKDVAHDIAPVRTGLYRSLIHVTERRRGFRLHADAPYSVHLEYGTRYMRAYRTLLIASQAAKRGL